MYSFQKSFTPSQQLGQAFSSSATRCELWQPPALGHRGSAGLRKGCETTWRTCVKPVVWASVVFGGGGGGVHHPQFFSPGMITWEKGSQVRTSESGTARGAVDWEGLRCAAG